MCKEYMIVSRLKKIEIEEFANLLSISCEEIIYEANLGGFKDNYVVVINGIDDVCLCSLNLWQRERLMDFINQISI